MSEVSIAEAARRSGLTRDQIIYIERQGYLGAVVRRRSTRYFTEAQVRTLARVAALRRIGMRLPEAAPLLGDRIGASVEDRQRLWVLAQQKAIQLQRDLDAWTYVTSLLHATPGDRDPDAA